MADQITVFTVSLTQILSRYSIHPPPCEYDIIAMYKDPWMVPRRLADTSYAQQPFAHFNVVQ